MDAMLITAVGLIVAGAACVEMHRRQRRAEAARAHAEAALHESASQLRQAQRMEAMGRLAGGISHDFNNLLTTMLGYTEFVLQDSSLSAGTRHDVEQVHRSAKSAVGLTRQLLAFSRTPLLNPTVLDLNHVVTEFVAMLRRVVGEDIVLRTALSSEPAYVMADRGQLEQVLMNLAVNARDAMRGGGCLALVVRASDGHVTLEVQDSGCGIPGDQLPRIFEPFFTTKEAGAGTGLGLATVHGIVTQSGGTIQVESSAGRGTSFQIALPRSAAPPAVLQPAPTAVVVGGRETVLVVEDEPAVNTLIRSALERQGYTVLVAENGAAAVDIVRRHAPGIDLVLSDVVLPEMSGTEVLSRVAELRPALPVMLMSGYSAQSCRRMRDMPDTVTFLQKPFTPASLATTVRETLDASRPELITA